MALLPPSNLPEGEKLELFRRLDQFRRWQSMDDKRHCMVCGKVINGHDILAMGGMRGGGPLRVICPSLGCNSIPMDWALPTSEALARVEVPRMPHIERVRYSRSRPLYLR